MSRNQHFQRLMIRARRGAQPLLFASVHRMIRSGNTQQH